MLQTALLLLGLPLLPLGNPVITPAQWIAYIRAAHLRAAVGLTGNTIFPQYLSDRFGWDQQLNLVQQALATLSPEDRANVRILCSNYGEAAALEFLTTDAKAPQVIHSGLPGSVLPPVISGHNNYFLWGPQNATGEVMILINSGTLADIRESYAEATPIGRVLDPYAMPFERHATVYVARHRFESLTPNWPDLKHFD